MGLVRVLVVHGCCHGRDPADVYVPSMVEQTRRALEAAVPGGWFAVSVPFYGPVLEEYIGDALADETNMDDVRLLAEQMGLAADLSAIRTLERSRTSAGSGGWATLIAGAEPDSELVRPEWLPGWARDWLLATSHRDVAAYQTSDGAARAVWQVVAAAWAELQPDLVIAHSLGSVVAWEMLANGHAPGDRSSKLLTIGSPLGGNHILKNRLRADLDTTLNTEYWQNFNDPGDLVSDGEWLDPDGFTVDEETKVNNPSWNSHSYDGYLLPQAASEKLAQLI